MKNVLKILSIIFCLSYIINAQTVLKVLPQTQTIKIDSTAVINLDIENIQNFRAFSIEISYNPELLKCESVQSGNFFSNWQTFFYTSIDTIHGQVQIDEAILGTGAEDGSGSLAQILFKGKSNGESLLDFLNIDLRDSLNASINITAEEGSIIVNNISDYVEDKNIPITKILLSNYPNPFNSSTIIKFVSLEDDEAELKIYSLTGEMVYNIFFNAEKGENNLRWNGKSNDGINLNSAIYIISIITKSNSFHTKVVMLK